MAYRTFLFDLDGTLIDSVELIVASHRHTRRVHFGDSLDDARYVASMGRPLADIYADMAGGDASSAAEMVATYREWNLANHDAMVRAYPGIAGVLSALSTRGARLAVVTSKLRGLALRGLEVCGLAGYFDVVVAADDVPRGKPDPLPVLQALRALGSDPGSAVMVGDSTHDMHAGRAAGVATAAVLWGPFSREQLAATAPDHVLDQVQQLVSL